MEIPTIAMLAAVADHPAAMACPAACSIAASLYDV
jgi:hypothetical protein